MVEWLQCCKLKYVCKGFFLPRDTGSILNSLYHCCKLIIICFVMRGLFCLKSIYNLRKTVVKFEVQSYYQCLCIASKVVAEIALVRHL